MRVAFLVKLSRKLTLRATCPAQRAKNAHRGRDSTSCLERCVYWKRKKKKKKKQSTMKTKYRCYYDFQRIVHSMHVLQSECTGERVEERWGGRGLPWDRTRNTWWRMGCRIGTAPWSPAVYPRSHPPPPRDRWSWWRQPAGSYCRCLWTPLRNYPSQSVLVSWISARGPPSGNRNRKLSPFGWKFEKGNDDETGGGGGGGVKGKDLAKLTPQFAVAFCQMLQWRKFERILRRPGSEIADTVLPNFVSTSRNRTRRVLTNF